MADGYRESMQEPVPRPGEHPKADDLRRANRWMICLFMVGAVVVGVVADSVEAFLLATGLLSASIAVSVLMVESGGLLPSGTSPSGARRWMIRLLCVSALLGVVSLLLLATHSATVPALAALVFAVGAGAIGARLLTL